MKNSNLASVCAPLWFMLILAPLTDRFQDTKNSGLDIN